MEPALHADASKRKAVSYKRLLELENQLQAKVEELFALGEQSAQPEALNELVVSKEIERQQDRLVRRGLDQSGAGSSREGAGGSRAGGV